MGTVDPAGVPGLPADRRDRDLRRGDDVRARGPERVVRGRPPDRRALPGSVPPRGAGVRGRSRRRRVEVARREPSRRWLGDRRARRRVARGDGARRVVAVPGRAFLGVRPTGERSRADRRAGRVRLRAARGARRAPRAVRRAGRARVVRERGGSRLVVPVASDRVPVRPRGARGGVGRDVVVGIVRARTPVGGARPGRARRRVAHVLVRDRALVRRAVRGRHRATGPTRRARDAVDGSVLRHGVRTARAGDRHPRPSPRALAERGHLDPGARRGRVRRGAGERTRGLPVLPPVPFVRGVERRGGVRERAGGLPGVPARPGDRDDRGRPMGGDPRRGVRVRGRRRWARRRGWSSPSRCSRDACCPRSRCRTARPPGPSVVVATCGSVPIRSRGRCSPSPGVWPAARSEAATAGFRGWTAGRTRSG